MGPKGWTRPEVSFHVVTRPSPSRARELSKHHLWLWYTSDSEPVFQDIDDLALSLIAKLDSIGRAQLSAKPLVFLAHSLGGIVLKRALVQMANAGEKYKFMLGTVRGVIAFGVPNRGMSISHLLPMVLGQPNQDLIYLLSPESEYLSCLDDQFGGIALLGNIRLLSVYETAKTPTPQVRHCRSIVFLTKFWSNYPREHGREVIHTKFSSIEYQLSRKARHLAIFFLSTRTTPI